MSPDCPNCGAWITKVVMTAMESECDTVVRRRHCEFCDHRFYTRQGYEEIVDVKWKPGAGKNKSRTIPKVVKVHPTLRRRQKIA